MLASNFPSTKTHNLLIIEKHLSTSFKNLGCSKPSTSAEYNSYIDVVDDGYYYNQSDFSLTFDNKGDLNAAIAASLSDKDNSSVKLESVADIIQEFICENVKSDSNPARIVIRRKEIIQTIISAIQRKRFSFYKPLVLFSGDNAVD